MFVYPELRQPFDSFNYISRYHSKWKYVRYHIKDMAGTLFLAKKPFHVLNKISNERKIPDVFNP